MFYEKENQRSVEQKERNQALSGTSKGRQEFQSKISFPWFDRSVQNSTGSEIPSSRKANKCRWTRQLSTEKKNGKNTLEAKDISDPAGIMEAAHGA